MKKATIDEWRYFYKTVCGLEVDLSSFNYFSNLVETEGALVIAKGLTLEFLFFGCRHHFGAIKYDIDFTTITSSRRTYMDYIVVLEKGNLIDPVRFVRYVPLTFEERLVLELRHYQLYGALYDTRFINLCLGSRYPDGRAPAVFVKDRVLQVGVPLSL